MKVAPIEPTQLTNFKEPLEVHKNKTQPKPKPAGYNKLPNQDEPTTQLQPQVSEDELIDAIEFANESYIGKYTRMEFSIHDRTKAIMVKVYDKESDELIREIPPEKVLDMVATMWELAGILVDDRV